LPCVSPFIMNYRANYYTESIREKEDVCSKDIKFTYDYQADIARRRYCITLWYKMVKRGDPMGKSKKFNLRSIWQAVGMIISGLIFSFSAVANLISLPKVNWGIAMIIAFVLFVGFALWQIVILQNKINNLEREKEETTPVLRIKDYGNEHKDMHRPLWSNYLYEEYKQAQETIFHYDTLFVDVFNKQKRGAAEKVWSTIEWINENGNLVLTHQGRWLIATQTMNNEKVRENLQYQDFDTNQSVHRLYFACINNGDPKRCLYGLERNMDGKDSWDNNPKYRLEASRYIVKIILRGSNSVYQEFKYGVRNYEGIVYIEKALTDESVKE
jgi:hypothetical protein